MQSPFSRPHYAWIIAGVGLLASFCCLGLARFAFGMMLPGMADNLGLDYGQQGILGTGYFLGYLACVAMLPILTRRLSARQLITIGLLIISMTLAAISQTREFALLTFLYALTGIGSGCAFVPVMSLASHWFHPSHRGRAAGIFLAGAGLGIIVSGFIVPRLQPAFGLAPWQVGWLVFAGLSLILAVISAVMLRNRPAEMGLQPYGRPPGPDVSTERPARDHSSGRSVILHLGAIYALYGLTYMVYTTFIVTTMVQDFTLSRDDAGDLWAWVGFISMFSGALFGLISDHLGRRMGMMIAFAVFCLAYALVALNMGPLGLYISITLFGFTAWSIPTIISAAAGDYLGVDAAAGGLAMMTFIFTIGQSVGPAMGGYLAQATGGFAVGYGITAALAVVAIMLCFWLRPPHRAPV